MFTTIKIISTKIFMLGQFEDLSVLREENFKAVNLKWMRKAKTLGKKK